MFVKAFIMESEVKDSLSVYKVCSVLFTHTHTHLLLTNTHRPNIVNTSPQNKLSLA